MTINFCIKWAQGDLEEFGRYSKRKQIKFWQWSKFQKQSI